MLRGNMQVFDRGSACRRESRERAGQAGFAVGPCYLSDPEGRREEKEVGGSFLD